MGTFIVDLHRNTKLENDKPTARNLKEI